MKKKTVGVILFSFLLVVIIGLVLYYFYINNREVVFYATVTDTYGTSAIVDVLPNDKLYDKHKVIEVDAKNLKVGQIVKFTSNGEFLETYPEKIQIKDYKVLVNPTTTRTTTGTSTTTTDIIPIIKRVTTIVYKTTTGVISKEENVSNVIYNHINSVSTYGSNPTLKENAKESFIKIIDFIFYDKDINGVFFKDLTNEAKLKVIGLALKLDNIIDKEYPGYKKEMSNSYVNAKSKLIELYLNNTTEYCNNHDKVCDQAKADFNEMKKSLNITWDVIKSIKDASLTKLKEWYQIYSGK